MPKHSPKTPMPKRRKVETKLSVEQEKMLNKHSSEHTNTHMALMRRLMKQGLSFADAHKEAQAKVGK